MHNTHLDEHEDGGGACNGLKLLARDGARGQEGRNHAAAESEGEADDGAGLRGEQKVAVRALVGPGGPGVNHLLVVAPVATTCHCFR